MNLKANQKKNIQFEEQKKILKIIDNKPNLRDLWGNVSQSDIWSRDL